MRGVISADGTTSAKIERAAVTLFSVRGIDRVSTKEIAATAKVSEGVIYRHFKNKDDLARRLMEAEHKNITALIRGVHDTAPDDIHSKVSRVVSEYCQAADRDWTIFVYYLLNFHRMPPGPQVGPDTPTRVANDIVKAAQDRGEIPKDHTALRASMALGVVLQTATSKIYNHIQTPMTPLIPILTGAAMAVLKANGTPEGDTK